MSHIDTDGSMRSVICLQSLVMLPVVGLRLMSLLLPSGAACGVVAGSSIPNYCVMSDTVNVARSLEKQGEGMRIHIR